MTDPAAHGAPPPPSPDLFEVTDPVDVDVEIAHLTAGDKAPDVIAGAVTGALADPGSGRWRITSADEADWAMRRLAQAAEQLGEVTARREVYLRKAARWYEAVSAGPRQALAFFEAHLADYALRVREASPRRRGEPTVKTVKLLAGEIATRGAPAPRVEIADPDVVIDWALGRLPDAVTVTYTVKVSDLRKYVEIGAFRGGEFVHVKGDPAQVVPGVAVVHPPMSATPKPYPTEE